MSANTFEAIKETAARLAVDLEQKLDADVMAIIGPIVPGVETKVRHAAEATKNKRKKLAVILSTPGGVVEIVERMVTILRHHYGEVVFVIPDAAMSAGTVFAMSGDAIMMSYFSCLGPIDPQVQRNGTLVPALSYLVQYKRLSDKAAAGKLNTAEFALFQKFDLAELHKFEEARELSTTLLVKWLANYKFKDWTETKTNKKPVTQSDREVRASEIATKLADHQFWHSHARGIPMQVLVNDLKLSIDDFMSDPDQAGKIDRYFSFLSDLMGRENFGQMVHTASYL